MAGFTKNLELIWIVKVIGCLFFLNIPISQLSAQTQKIEQFSFNGKLEGSITLSPDCVFFYKNLSNKDDISIIEASDENNFRISKAADYFLEEYDNNNSWFIFAISNISKIDTLKLFLEYGRIDYLKVFQKTDKKTSLVMSGQNLNLNKRIYPTRFIIPLAIPPNKHSTFYINPHSSQSYAKNFHFSLLSTELTFKKLQKEIWPKMRLSASMGFFYGALTLIGVFALFQYMVEFDRVYLFYMLYVFSIIFFYMIHRVTDTPSFFSNHIEQVTGSSATVIYLSLGLYCLFLKEFLNVTKEKYYFINLVLVACTNAFFAGSLIYFLSFIFEANTTTFQYGYSRLTDVFRLIAFLLCPYVIYKMRGNTLFNFIIAGSIFLLVFNIISSKMGAIDRDILAGNTTYGAFTIRLLHMDLKFSQIGILLEFICFSLGLSYRTKNQILEKERKLSTINEKLAQSNLENINKEKEKAIFQRQIMETELKALKAQMNPHFVANALNSIKCLIQENHSEEATKYLAVFSELVRTILNFSEETFITLEQELTFCKLFIEIESLRFKNNFSYEISVNKNIDLGYIKIPPLILQPFIENAIWHGLTKIQETRELNIKIQITQQYKYINCIIEDNGIGRKAAALIKQKSTFQKKSYGLSLTKERLKNTNQRYDTDFRLKIIDNESEEGMPLGTRVELNFTN